MAWLLGFGIPILYIVIAVSLGIHNTRSIHNDHFRKCNRSKSEVGRAASPYNDHYFCFTEDPWNMVVGPMVWPIYLLLYAPLKLCMWAYKRPLPIEREEMKAKQEAEAATQLKKIYQEFPELHPGFKKLYIKEAQYGKDFFDV